MDTASVPGPAQKLRGQATTFSAVDVDSWVKELGHRETDMEIL